MVNNYFPEDESVQVLTAAIRVDVLYIAYNKHFKIDSLSEIAFFDGFFTLRLTLIILYVFYTEENMDEFSKNFCVAGRLSAIWNGITYS